MMHARSTLVAVLLATVLALPVGFANAAAASPSPALGAGDTRSSGQGAGLAGQPVLVAVGVVALGLAAAGLTTLYVRVTRTR
jgi:hypothetical protein